ncbi:hypothetical protein C0Q70_11344 [Pomacea canaliculata]|uniref:Uncharacterized protein n=1 Tax=Pomacea canaliculata TaxID=400727 RepID=A0A2T7P5P7_POMCA|nr:hypothetical protein C0Q70_11344 [Pomacea canaliculata]
MSSASRRGSLTQDMVASLASLGALAARRNSTKRTASSSSAFLTPSGDRISHLKRKETVKGTNSNIVNTEKVIKGKNKRTTQSTPPAGKPETVYLT